MSPRVDALAIAPVKGMRVASADVLELGPTGAAGDRAFLVVDAASHDLLLSTRNPRLLQIAPEFDPGSRTLTLRFPSGAHMAAVVEPGPPATTANYAGRPIRGRVVAGPLAEGVSEPLGRRGVLLERDAEYRGADDAPVTLMSAASLAALAPGLDGTVPDPRRFRMTIAIGGVAAWEEHGWGGREIAVGEALLRGVEPVPRCAVTTRDPEDGRRDAPVLKALAALRGPRDVTFGLWCEVLGPGRVRVGDAVDAPTGHGFDDPG